MEYGCTEYSTPTVYDARRGSVNDGEEGSAHVRSGEGVEREWEGVEREWEGRECDRDRWEATSPGR
jgi:hypothetical protein